MHDARVAAKKFFKQEVPIYGTISWLPVAHLDGDERARDVFEREAEKRADAFAEYVSARYLTNGTASRCVFRQLLEEKWEERLDDLLESRRQGQAESLRDLLL
jgi:hypothetical protein